MLASSDVATLKESSSLLPSLLSFVRTRISLLPCAASHAGSGRCCVQPPGRRCDDHCTGILSDHIPRSSSGLVLRTHDAHQGSCVHSSYREAQHRDSRSGCSCHAGCWLDGAFSFSYFFVLEITFLPLPGEVRASPYVVVIYLDFQKHPLLNPWTSFFVHFSTQPFFPEADLS